MFNKNSGYVGYSMSVRAYEAYQNNEKPLSKRTKEDFREAFENTKVENLLKLPLKDLKDYCLHLTSRHHTGKFCNYTYFYSLKDLEDLEGLNVDSILEENKKARENKPKKVKAEPTYITALIKRVYKENRGSMRHPNIYIVTETFTTQYMSTNKQVKNCFHKYSLNSQNITVLYKKEQKTKFYSLKRFENLKEVKKLVEENNHKEKEKWGW